MNRKYVIGALLFALHPVCVESVAWISEQKNTLSLVFYLLAALTYLRFEDGPGGRRPANLYGLSLCLFVLAVLSKSVTSTLPAALLISIWWKRGRLDWKRDVAPLLPWLAAGALGLGVGSSIYKPGDDAQTVERKAKALVAALHAWAAK